MSQVKVNSFISISHMTQDCVVHHGHIIRRKTFILKELILLREPVLF